MLCWTKHSLKLIVFSIALPGSDGHQKWVDFILSFWHCECISSFSEKLFSNRYQKWCKKNKYNFFAEKAFDIWKFFRKQAFTLQKNSHTELLITSAAAQLTTVSKTVEILKAEMLSLAKMLPEYPAVMKIYGVGETIGPQLMAEIGDVRRFARKQSLVAFAGVDPEPNQSGKSDTKSNSASKHGSPLLRKAFFLSHINVASTRSCRRTRVSIY